MQLTIATVTPEGWQAVTPTGVRVAIPSAATGLNLRVGQLVWAELTDSVVERVWIGVASPQS